MNYVSELNRDQIMIEALNQYIDEENEVIIIDKVVDAMDLESLGFEMGKNYDSGRPKYYPKNLLKLYLYGYSKGIRSSRKLAKQA